MTQRKKLVLSFFSFLVADGLPCNDTVCELRLENYTRNDPNIIECVADNEKSTRISKIFNVDVHCKFSLTFCEHRWFMLEYRSTKTYYNYSNIYTRKKNRYRHPMFFHSESARIDFMAWWYETRIESFAYLWHKNMKFIFIVQLF